jgi:hypothetical protein
MQHAIMANLAPEAPTTNLAPGAALSANIWLLRLLCQRIIVGRYLAPARLRWKICGSVGKFGSCNSSVGKYVALSANMRLRQQICFCGSSAGKYEAPSANLASEAAPSANIWLRRLCRQSFSSDGKSGFSAAQSANIWVRRQNNWLRRQIIGSVGQFGFCGSSVGKYLDPAALSAIMSLRRQIWLLGSSVGKYLATSANIWLRRQIIGSVGQFGFCGSSFGKYLDPAALPAVMSLRRKIWRLGSSVGKYLGPSANLWLFGSIDSSVGK